VGWRPGYDPPSEGEKTSPVPRPAAREDPRPKEAFFMTIVWILIVIILVLLVIALARRVL
jgi:hypothetical protein